MPNWVLPASIAALVTALVATSAAALVQFRAADQARAERDALAAEVEQLEGEVDELRTRLDRTDGTTDGGLLDGELGRLLDDLLGGADDGAEPDVGGLLDDLLGGGGLLGSAAPPGAACLTSELADGFDPGDLLGGTTPTDLDALVDEVGSQVAEIRELSWAQDIEVAFLDDGETRARLDELTTLAPQERVATRATEQLLIALGAVDDDLDLEAVQQQLLGDTVAGFYIPETGETVVRVPGDDGPGPADRITLAHELDHALTDQVLGLPEFDAPPLRDDRDAATAALALIEGDASLVMSQWSLAHLSLFDQLRLATDPAVVAAGGDLEGVPAVIVADLLFPYTAGLDFVCDRYLDGGWAAIDAAYDQPPTTTAEILFGEPVDPIVPEGLQTPGPAFDELARTSFGAAELGFHLDAPGGDPDDALDDARGRIAAWGGGQSVVYDDGDRTAAGLALRDAGTGTATLCDTMTAWAALAFDATPRAADAGITGFEGPRSAAVNCPGDDVLIGLAEDLATATRIAGG